MQKIFETIQIRFILAGILNTMVGLTLGFIFISLLPLHYTTSLFLATCISVIFNYISSSTLVFKQKKSLKTTYLFFLNYAAIYLLNILLIELIVRAAEIEEQYAFILITPIGVLITYWTQKNFIFQQK
jgi:putative flippase GtrA